MPTYNVTFDLGTQTVTVDAEDHEHAVASATDRLLERAYIVVGQATITVDESHDVELEL
jgi:hypothetical protein